MKKYYIVRSSQAGVFAGYITKRTKDSVVMSNARRIWYWDGAASLSQLATDGTSKPENCKFPVEVKELEVFGVCEILTCTAKAQKSIKSVKIWKQ